MAPFAADTEFTTPMDPADLAAIAILVEKARGEKSGCALVEIDAPEASADPGEAFPLSPP